jgi:hypothetical protein
MFLQKHRQKNPKPTFSRFLLSRFWAFLGGGSSKTRLKNLGKNLTNPGTFLAPEQPTNHVGVRHFVVECALRVPHFIAAICQKYAAIRRFQSPPPSAPGLNRVFGHFSAWRVQKHHENGFPGIYI